MLVKSKQNLVLFRKYNLGFSFFSFLYGLLGILQQQVSVGFESCAHANTFATMQQMLTKVHGIQSGYVFIFGEVFVQGIDTGGRRYSLLCVCFTF